MVLLEYVVLAEGVCQICSMMVVSIEMILNYPHVLSLSSKRGARGFAIVKT